MSNRWKEPNQPSVSYSDWSRYVENKNGRSDSKADESSIQKQKARHVADWMIDDLAIDGLLNQLAETENEAQADSFVDSVMGAITRAEDSKSEKEEIPSIRPFEMLDQQMLNGEFHHPDQEYEIEEHMTEPVNGSASGKLNGKTTSASSLNGTADSSVQKLRVKPPSIAKARKSEPAKKEQSEVPPIPGAATMFPPQVSDKNKDQKTTRMAGRSAWKNAWWQDRRILLSVAVIVLVAIGIGVGWIASMNGEPNGSIVEEGKGPETAGDQNKEIPDSNLANHSNSDHQKGTQTVLKQPKNPITKDESKLVDDSKKSLDNIKNETPKSLDKKSPSMVNSHPKQKDDTKHSVASKDNTQFNGPWFGKITSRIRPEQWAAAPGPSVYSEELTLKEGTIELEMKNGTEVKITGPARFQLLSESQMELHSGKLSAFVSEQVNGFTVETPSTTVVDLGTRFEVTVDDKNASRVFVSQGLVEVTTKAKKKGDSRKWQQKAGQSSVVSENGEPVEWLLSFQFDKNGFGMIEFNGQILNDVVHADNAEFLLRNIIRSISPKIRVAEKHLTSPLTGAIVIDDETFLFKNANQVHKAHSAAGRKLRKVEFRELDLLNFANARQQFIERRNRLIEKTKSINKDDQKTNKRLTGQQMIASASNQAGNINIRFPTSSSVITFASSGQQDLAKLITDQTMAILESKRKKTDRKSIRNKSGRIERQPDNLFPQMVQIGDFGRFPIPGLIDNPAAFKQKQRIQTSEEEVLKKQLFDSVAEVDLFRNLNESSQMIKAVSDLNRIARRTNNLHGDPTRDEIYEPIKDLLPSRPDLANLPMKMGDDCILDTDKSKSLAAVSNFMGTTLSTFNRFGSLPMFDNQDNSFRDAMVTRTIDQCCRQYGKRQSVPGLVQMLQADHPRVRYDLVRALSDAGGKEAAVALANRAKYDMNPEIRIAAAEALRDFPLEQYQSTLLEGFNYPWAPVAQHTAEAVVHLGDEKIVDELVEQIDQPDPTVPFKNKKGRLALREVIAINHMRNCLLCHAPSRRTDDPVRGNVPSPGEPLPQKYYQRSSGAFVRADVTYIQQDFSVIQPVENPGPWPKMQRYDYVVQTRELTPVEKQKWARVDRNRKNAHRDSVVFALKELTGKKPAKDTSKHWRQAVDEFKREKLEQKNRVKSN